VSITTPFTARRKATLRNRRVADPFQVAVLGSARLDEDSPAWSTAVELGRRLAEGGATVVTGGYQGLMAAVSRGAHEAGGHVVGLTMSAWTSLRPNEWVAEARASDDYGARLRALLDMDAVVALDGGVGTLSELAVVWAAAQTEPSAPAIVVLGAAWPKLLEAFRDELVIDERDLALLRVAATPAEAANAALIAGRAARNQPRG
jgi:uncharacterized protein (TIGR00730 family)